MTDKLDEKPPSESVRAKLPYSIFLSNGQCLIESGTAYPLKHEFTLTTEQDDQTSIELKLLRANDGENKVEAMPVLGRYYVKNLPKRPKGQTKVNVAFNATSTSVWWLNFHDAETGDPVKVDRRDEKSADRRERPRDSANDRRGDRT
jgi:molecular chaperone DnaK (HSP70)